MKLSASDTNCKLSEIGCVIEQSKDNLNVLEDLRKCLCCGIGLAESMDIVVRAENSGYRIESLIKEAVKSNNFHRVAEDGNCSTCASYRHGHTLLCRGYCSRDRTIKFDGGICGDEIPENYICDLYEPKDK